MIERYILAVLDPDARLNQLQQVCGSLQFTLTHSASAEELITSVCVDKPDAILLDLKMSGQSGWELAKRLRMTNPAIPILLLSANPDWSVLERDPLIEMVRSPYDPNEVLQRLSRLLHPVSQNDSPSNYRLPHLVVDDLRSENGRIDAKKVAEMFGLSVPALARIIDSGEPALYKTPDARSIQSKLNDFERIAWGLLKLTGSVRGLRIWLNAPNPELEKDLPIDYIKDGHVEEVAAMVEDALLGHPS
ncbi:MAG: response regulator [Candidatus Melainabacteria bacterium]|nr:response regulator [Candidatus Melainabacteria bacterium]